MSEPAFKVRERPDSFKLRQSQTPKEVSSGKRPDVARVIQFSVDEYNKPKTNIRELPTKNFESTERGG